MNVSIPYGRVDHPELQKLLGASAINHNLGAQINQYANCPLTLGSLVEPTSTFVRDVGTPIAQTVRSTLSDTGKGFLKLISVHIFGPLFLLGVFFIVILALVGIFGWWTALIMIFVLFAILYLFTISFTQSVSSFVQNNVNDLQSQINGIITRSNTGNIAQTFLNANQRSLIACNGANHPLGI
ncbi:MAG: hypothetical protein Solumvirus5_23 [Solumvirus sp.]|uniref:Uncharacterized protein n=1 Tax=Solumvirus sp. TaxID=2487773 RepID=A0A3G5AGK1_9VIRU|nr:MAG: hypothetical protein Solumvirus5_23 [Solumvirus sp.]